MVVVGHGSVNFGAAATQMTMTQVMMTQMMMTQMTMGRSDQ